MNNIRTHQTKAYSYISRLGTIQSKYKRLMVAYPTKTRKIQLNKGLDITELAYYIRAHHVQFGDIGSHKRPTLEKAFMRLALKSFEKALSASRASEGIEALGLQDRIIAHNSMGVLLVNIGIKPNAAKNHFVSALKLVQNEYSGDSKNMMLEVLESNLQGNARWPDYDPVIYANPDRPGFKINLFRNGLL